MNISTRERRLSYSRAEKCEFSREGESVSQLLWRGKRGGGAEDVKEARAILTFLSRLFHAGERERDASAGSFDDREEEGEGVFNFL